MHTKNRIRAQAGVVLMALTLAACGGGGGGDDVAATPTPTPSPTPSPSPAPTPAGSQFVTADLTACPNASYVISSTEWMSCMAGKRLVGTEPFNGTACELHVGSDGGFQYLRGGAVALTMLPRTSWVGAWGSYTNSDMGVGRQLLASIFPGYPRVAGQNTVNSIELTLSSLPNTQDTVEVEYFDTNALRQTYTCVLSGID